MFSYLTGLLITFVTEKFCRVETRLNATFSFSCENTFSIYVPLHTAPQCRKINLSYGANGKALQVELKENNEEFCLWRYVNFGQYQVLNINSLDNLGFRRSLLLISRKDYPEIILRFENTLIIKICHRGIAQI